MLWERVYHAPFSLVGGRGGEIIVCSCWISWFGCILDVIVAFGCSRFSKSWCLLGGFIVCCWVALFCSSFVSLFVLYIKRRQRHSNKCEICGCCSEHLRYELCLVLYRLNVPLLLCFSICFTALLKCRQYWRFISSWNSLDMSVILVCVYVCACVHVCEQVVSGHLILVLGRFYQCWCESAAKYFEQCPSLVPTTPC